MNGIYSNGQKPVSVFSKKELDANWNKKCLVYGTYKIMMLPKSARPGSQLIPTNRIVIVLSDSTNLALEIQDLGLRAPEEKEKYLNCQVLVSGTLKHFAQLWGTPNETAIVMNAIVDIDKIELIKQ